MPVPVALALLILALVLTVLTLPLFGFVILALAFQSMLWIVGVAVWGLLVVVVFLIGGGRSWARAGLVFFPALLLPMAATPGMPAPGLFICCGLAPLIAGALTFLPASAGYFDEWAAVSISRHQDPGLEHDEET